MIKQDPYINRLVFSEYLIQKKIGRGSFGTVYQGIIVSTNQKIAVKLEKRKKDDTGLLETEACRLYLMQGEGIPKIICYGNNQTHNILVQELLGNSLEELFNLNKRKFTLKTVCSIGIEMIKRIRFVHSKNHLHRDIKPDNFMTGLDKSDDKIYLIDFGLAKKYYSSSKKQHIKFKMGKNLIGTARYCGRNAHRGYEQGRRDDIESIGYVLMYFLNGSLPWQGLKVLKHEDHFEKIAEKKYNTSFEELTNGHPEEFLLYFKHCDSLNFEDEPNYDYLLNLFETMINKYCFDCLYDYDWKKNIIPNLSYLSPIKDRDEENNNKEIKDISLLVNNNVSAIESKGEGKEENNINIKNKKDIFIGEDKNNKNTDFNNKILKRNKSSNLIMRHSVIKENLDMNNEIIDINKNDLNLNNLDNINNNNNGNNNIFIVKNEITPKIKNINININFNSDFKNNLNNKENTFDKGENHIFKNLYKNGKNDINNFKINNHQINIFNKKNIKKEYFFSYDENMDDMLENNNSSLMKNINIEYDKEKENNFENKLKKDKLARFQQPKKVENIFTEEDIKTEDINETKINDFENEENNKSNKINNSLINNDKNNNNDIMRNNNNKNKYTEKKDDKDESKNKKHKHHHHHNHHSRRNSDILNYDDNKNEININNDKSLIKNNDNNKEKENIIKTNSSKRIIKSLNYDEIIKKEEIMKKEENIENDGNKRKRRNRVKSVDNKLKRSNAGCYCTIF